MHIVWIMLWYFCKTKFFLVFSKVPILIWIKTIVWISSLRLLFQQPNFKYQPTERLTERNKVFIRPYALGSVKHMVYISWDLLYWVFRECLMCYLFWFVLQMLFKSILGSSKEHWNQCNLVVRDTKIKFVRNTKKRSKKEERKI